MTGPENSGSNPEPESRLDVGLRYVAGLPEESVSDQLLLTDCKTSRGKCSADQVDDSREQLFLSSQLAGELAPGKKFVSMYLVLTKTKEPVVEEHVREVRPDRVARTLTSVEQVWKAIASDIVYPAPFPVGCASCGYRRACEGGRG